MSRIHEIEAMGARETAIELRRALAESVDLRSDVRDLIEHAAELPAPAYLGAREDERQAWDVYGASTVAIAIRMRESVALAAAYADEMLAERRKRFGGGQ